MKHRQQYTPAGCQWHAAYALLEDEELLEHVDDICPMRFRFKLIEKGYFPLQAFGGLYEQRTPSHEWWRQFASDCTELAWVLADYVMPNSQWHQVAFVMNSTTVWVSDSGYPDIQAFWLEDFLKSRYSAAMSVHTLCSMQPDMWPPELVSQNPELLLNSERVFL